MNPFWAPSLLLLIVLPSLSVAAGFSGLVVSVLDGDVLDVQHEHGMEHIRLNGIDAPEKGQAFDQQAQQFVEEVAMGQHVIIETRGHDHYDRTLGEVFLLDGRHLNKELVKAGLAWWFCRHSSEAELKQLEDEAREANRGLWKDAVPTPPWVYRRLPEIQGPEVSEFDCPEPSYQLIHQQIAAASKEFDIIGHRRSHIYRRADCPGYDLVSEDQRIAFVTMEAAEQAGYRLDWKCP